ncbi:hypothetical protein [Brevibacillus dissolubilis]|uniref:hypothetical protein n=1 Tax=Brevibacillus dissolubilis TaxID=1844116 RepID=UPI0011176C84|nr:hypothetical protein [Brevibacillus dissolubilis]
MRKKIFLSLVLLLVAIVSIAAMNNPVKDYSYKLQLNEEITQAVSNFTWQESTKKAFQKAQIKKDKSSMDLKINVEPIPDTQSFAKMSAQGLIQLSGDNYPFTAEGLVSVLQSNRGEYYHGSLNGQIKNINVKNNLNNENVVIGIDMLPNEDKMIVSTNIGSMDQMALLFFGESFVDQELTKLIEQQSNSTTMN